MAGSISNLEYMEFVITLIKRTIPLPHRPPKFEEV